MEAEGDLFTNIYGYFIENIKHCNNFINNQYNYYKDTVRITLNVNMQLNHSESMIINIRYCILYIN